ncbi:MAG: glycosyltransferase [Microbacterium sp.]|uniref:glycosyltransferase n=1 Tax=Microbacterium sp. TaxID=51671 RepID=UPI002718A511|nr:glycosyltransferase [Microbacterium sp.]MDO8383189.1 glycosyltransferase [Microbacterium sp.]
MNLYARELLAAWAETSPQDELILVGGPWILDLVRRGIATKGEVIHQGNVTKRLWVQTIKSGLIARRVQADALLSLSPIAAFTFPSDRSFAVVHDWRHKRRPNEFSPVQRMYRRLWILSLRRVRRVFTISEKSAQETLQYSKVANSVVVRNGGDHPRHWAKLEPTADDEPRILTYGHFNNKRPEPVIEAVGLLRASSEHLRLTVLGARGKYRDELLAHARRSGAEDAVDFPGYVDEITYQSLLQQADVVVLNSSDEGYGLPVAEANFFGIPVIAASDSGLGEIHGSSVYLSDPFAASLAPALQYCLRKGRSTPSVKTWADASRLLRSAIDAAISKSE